MRFDAQGYVVIHKAYTAAGDGGAVKILTAPHEIKFLYKKIARVKAALGTGVVPAGFGDPLPGEPVRE